MAVSPAHSRHLEMLSLRLRSNRPEKVWNAALALSYIQEEEAQRRARRQPPCVRAATAAAVATELKQGGEQGKVYRTVQIEEIDP